MAIGQNIEVVQANAQGSVQKAKARAKAEATKAIALVKTSQNRAMILCKDPQFQTITISTATGAVVLGSVGGAFGTASGIVLGTVAGAVPALFTFGLSLPIGAVVGGGSGLCLGTATGLGAGAIGGGAVGYGGYKYRIEIKDGLVRVQKKALAAHAQTTATAGEIIAKTKTRVVVLVDGVRQKSLARAGELADKTKKLVADDKLKVTAASASAGAIVGGGTGAVFGGSAGAALGLIPALFTFGLSIPAGAVVGGCIGAASGTVTGAVGAGTAGYGGYTYRKEIRSGADAFIAKLKDHSETVKNKVRSSAARVSETAKSYKSA
jgi:phenylpyruvate tautomerase PptA (4-oxalocrotonate tautomerase family)